MKLFYVLRLNSLLFLLAGVVWLQAQTPQQLQLAERLMRGGNYESALQLFERHFKNGSTEPKVVNGISRCLRELGRTEEGVGFLKDVIMRRPGIYNYSIELAEAFYVNKQPDSAYATWRSVYATEPPQIMRYRLVAQSMANLRLFDEAAAVYNEALEKMPRQLALHFDLANLYRLQLDYDNAVDHYMVYFVRFPKQRAYVRSLILNMARDDEATQRIINRLEQNNPGKNNDMQELLAKLYMRKKDFNKAFDLYREIIADDQKTNFSYMRRFAVEAEKNQRWDHALNAYDLVLQKSAKPMPDITVKKAQVHYAFAQSLADSLPEKATQEVSRALALLNTLDGEKRFGLEAAELKGDIYLDYYEDLDRAMQHYNTIPRSTDITRTDRVLLKKARVALLKNDLLQAENYYSMVKSPRYKKLADFRFAELQLFRGYYKKAQQAFEKLLSQSGLADSLANNALQYNFEISTFSADSIAFAEYNNARLYQRRLKLGQAAKSFELVSRQARGALALEAAWQAAKLYNKLNESENAIALLQEGVERFSGQDDGDKLLFLLAEIEHRSGNEEQALTYYRRLLVEYPNSFYSEDARQAARLLTSSQRTETP